MYAFHRNFKDCYRKAPKLVALSAFLTGIATQCDKPYSNWMIAGGALSGVLGILLKKDDDDAVDTR